MNATTTAVTGLATTPKITRRGFVKVGGALFVSALLPPALTQLAAREPSGIAPLDPAELASWMEIRSDNSIIMRTGRTETGTGMSGYYPQAIAEELDVRPETVSLIMGDTDKTLDGGYSAGFLFGMYNVRKVAAYARQALLAMAAKQLAVPVTSLSVADGVVSGEGKSISYGKLVEGQHLELKIPIEGKMPHADSSEWMGVANLDGLTVAGDPPMKSPKDFKVMGKSHSIPLIPDKITGKTQWSCDVKLPGMLHARMVRPIALGASLISVGELDKAKFPDASVVKKANLVAVVSPDEWEALSAAAAVAQSTKWNKAAVLPGSTNLTQTLRAQDWGKPATKGKLEDVKAAQSSATHQIHATYEQPYVRHAPIGPFLAVADVKPDGTVTVWTHSAQSQGLRARLAFMLSVPFEKVTVRWLDQSGQYGRTTFGGDGAEADAVILSQLTGKPVRVEWTLEDDLAWSTVSPGWVSDISAATNPSGHITAIQSAFYSPHESDARLLGAILAQMPTTTTKSGMWIATEWPYDKIAARYEEAYGMENIGENPTTGGLRGNIMRTPGQRQQNFALEGLINEAAASAKADPIQFRKDHTTEPRLLELLDATAKAADWHSRPSPQAETRRTGSAPLKGRGMCIMLRENAYWAGIAEIQLVPATGALKVTRFTIGADPGKIINPRQLDRCMKSGVAMGLSEALKEEVTFDKNRVTSTSWLAYPILTMEELPEIRVVQISRDDKEFGGGSEAANAVVAPALTAAIFDATGVWARKIPLKPDYLAALLKA